MIDGDTSEWLTFAGTRLVGGPVCFVREFPTALAAAPGDAESKLLINLMTNAHRMKWLTGIGGHKKVVVAPDR